VDGIDEIVAGPNAGVAGLELGEQRHGSQPHGRRRIEMLLLLFHWKEWKKYWNTLDARSGEGDYGKDPRGLRWRPHARWRGQCFPVVWKVNEINSFSSSNGRKEPALLAAFHKNSTSS
jgi:hypothetical protein